MELVDPIAISVCKFMKFSLFCCEFVTLSGQHDRGNWIHWRPVYLSILKPTCTMKLQCNFPYSSPLFHFLCPCYSPCVWERLPIGQSKHKWREVRYKSPYLFKCMYIVGNTTMQWRIDHTTLIIIISASYYFESCNAITSYSWGNVLLTEVQHVV